MSKKTSKTSHVLNVLTSHSPEEEGPLVPIPEPMPEPEPQPIPEPVRETQPVREMQPVREIQPIDETEITKSAGTHLSPEISEQIKTKLAEEARRFLEGNFHPTGEAGDYMTDAIDNKKAGPEKYEFFYVNVLEAIVKEKVIATLRQTNSCLCNDCVNDAVALALNQLPPKYVVTTKGGLYVQAALHEKQYAVDIISATTQACIKVATQPNHSQRR